jgi:circadian clock protein KaiC
MLGLQFLLEGARQGEPGVHFALEETANQLRRIAQVFGWDLRPLEERGLLTFRYVSPSSSRPIGSCTRRGTTWRGWARAGPCWTA